MTAYAGLPKTIYSVWFQGLEAAPDLVRFNYEKWSALNPDYRVTVLDRRDVLELLAGSDLPIRDIPMQALSDVVRTLLLRDNGGLVYDGYGDVARRFLLRAHDRVEFAPGATVAEGQAA